MGEVTAISWADHTFNPWIGCTKVSVGDKGACEGCYAEAMMADRYGRVVWGKPGQKATYSRTAPANWRQPLKWEREQAALMADWGRLCQAVPLGDNPRPPSPFVFCASLADVFDNQVPAEWRRDLFDLIRATPHLTWLLLTKRPQNIARLFAETITPELRRAWSDPALLGRSFWPRNAAMGCTVVTQAEADRDVPHLLRAKAALKPAFAFLSMEPLMEAVSLPAALMHYHGAVEGAWEAAQGLDGVDWVITGGGTDQSGWRAPPASPAWFRDLRDQCDAAGVAYHHKQHGEWVADDGESKTDSPLFNKMLGAQTSGDGDETLYRVGKKLAGRALDGVLHNARPTTP